jgi:cytidylate kinase
MMNRRVCSICAWREHCQKRFSVSTDPFLNVNCPDYTRDVTIKDHEVDSKVVEYYMERLRTIKRPKRSHVITISRQPGAGGSMIARRLAEELQMDLVGSQIIEKVAESAKMSTKVVETLDEKAITRMESMINSMFESHHLTPDVYFRHLSRIIATIGEHGNTIIVGRGANFILPKEKTFRIRLIAPTEYRILHFMKIRDMTRPEAQKYIEKRDADRTGFIRKYYKADSTDSGHYDIIINTAMFGIEGTVHVLIGAVQYRIFATEEQQKSDFFSHSREMHT